MIKANGSVASELMDMNGPNSIEPPFEPHDLVSKSLFNPFQKQFWSFFACLILTFVSSGEQN